MIAEQQSSCSSAAAAVRYVRRKPLSFDSLNYARVASYIYAEYDRKAI